MSEVLATGRGAAQAHPLAVLIPTWSTRFLADTLASLAAQTDQRFTVYVGDDASPDDVRSLCSGFTDRLDLRYQRFASNLGGHDLVAQWTRCVQWTSEPWVWMIGDDDMLEPGCVAAFHAARRQHPGVTLFHFSVRRIDAAGKLLENEAVFPPVLSARQFLLGRLTFSLASYAPDYVFRRQTFDERGGFQRFPLAWCSDDATWATLAAPAGIRSVPGPRVSWRLSGSNISARSAANANAKIEAHLQFVEWLVVALPDMAQQAGEPDDATLKRWAAYWFFEQAERVGCRFRPGLAWRAARRLARSGVCSVPVALARSVRVNWHLARAG